MDKQREAELVEGMHGAANLLHNIARAVEQSKTSRDLGAAVEELLIITQGLAIMGEALAVSLGESIQSN